MRTVATNSAAISAVSAGRYPAVVAPSQVI
jgi:hypothetical protein